MPRQNDVEKVTPLLELLRACTRDQRLELAELAGVAEVQLYTYAGQHREPLVNRAIQIVEASKTMHERYPKLRALTIEEISP